jgi:FkbM family methyltransferase
MQRILKEGDTVIDVGAFIGYYTLIFAKLVGKDGLVYAFEPDPENFALLRKNVEINEYKNVVLIQKAVADFTGKTRLYLSKENKGDHRIYDLGDGRDSIEIEVTRLDDCIGAVPVNLVKIDAEGAEVRVLKGMQSLLEKSVRLSMMIECFPSALERFGDSVTELLNLLGKQGLLTYNINVCRKELERLSFDFFQRYTAEHNNHTNLLCVRKDVRL